MTKRESKKLLNHLIADLVVAEYQYKEGKISQETLLYTFKRYRTLVSLYLDHSEYEEFLDHPLIQNCMTWKIIKNNT